MGETALKALIVYNKFNRNIYQFLYEATVAGLTKCGIHFEVLRDTPKTINKTPVADLNICLNNVRMKTHSVYEKAKKKGLKYLTLQLGEWDNKGPVNLSNRELYRLAPKALGHMPIFCNLLDDVDYQDRKS